MQARRLGGSLGSVDPPLPRSSELVPLAIKIIYSLLLYVYMCIATCIARENEITIHVVLF